MTLAAFSELSCVMEEIGHPDTKEMIRIFSDDQESLAAAARGVIKSAEAAGDDASDNFGVRRLDVHQKNAWMLRSHLE